MSAFVFVPPCWYASWISESLLFDITPQIWLATSIVGVPICFVLLLRWWMDKTGVVMRAA
jgi:hypothetical protein